MRRTKIIATIGPSSSDKRVLSRMIKAGIDVARLNFSHGTRAEHERNFRNIRNISAAIGKPVGIIGDLQGPKMRIGELAEAPLELHKSESLIITTRKLKGVKDRISTTCRRLHQDVKSGDRILIDDGSIEAKVVRVEGRDIHCRIIRGGKLDSHKGINLPRVNVSEPPITRKDREDVRFAVELGVDYLALSFVRRASDIARLKDLLKRLNADIPVIAKIEKPEALKNIDDIISMADGIMVARGDLGVEMSPEKVPQIQKDIIARCGRAGKPAITATQMLESMISRPLPTRAESSDVANAIFDGTDAVMLSGETAVGDYPVHAVKMMARIATEADTYIAENMKEQRATFSRRSGTTKSFANAIGQATVSAARQLAARLVVCFTSSGFTAQQVSSYRPDVPIIAATHDGDILPRMSLYWGVKPICIREAKTVDAMITNFHLSKSTLLMLVFAFAGREKVLNAYQTAMNKGYRFFSYGDAMLIA